ncbi:hypothetical protein GQF56_21415 [Rhodobacter sphaeroides]|jgi:hypothetical protein|uniref:Uncharacterized protein n=1 Tax=Cereibacter sphaeroides (strain ATCC 17023 / DSM 158 / JCM 6121 / CCUG 31486 / LMG 2827 / NBRC 12203 / NCIMB 8253 / ATH 2.4.1.) TaxID=272943 RepID=Q3IV30_CERS4|nr:hypothetical protein [Cereibacter sphaeroides]ABA81604.1 hypothetical protein RSP_4132 [Cereibacter sphaeroides 2.4.1]AMJ50085.1 hypothetical protein APX01_21250 [Cereibacter sphaeroides]ANS36705.1 hypothetical protein A3858_20795 [Cereibacter sphaeroides]ATN65873.1 hypothetical protein A3857_21365 [Cereibacter sphaeroides]AXC64037.1 hypothetical protein DQL45_21900 [Cereibacter sphaeroides 2.4.1]
MPQDFPIGGTLLLAAADVRRFWFDDIEAWLSGFDAPVVQVAGPIVMAEWLDSNLWGLGAFYPGAEKVILDWQTAPHARIWVDCVRRSG